ncbi:hypothetical protein [Paraburkholderia antibiotica]
MMVLDGYMIAPGQFPTLWPSSRQMSSKRRVFVGVFVDFMCTPLFQAP